MRLSSFSVKNYRSIVRTERILIGDTTVLVGPNNEGESNILRALILAMKILTRARLHTFRNVPPSILRRVYDWERDYPIHLQEKTPDGETELILEFVPTKGELEEFKAEVKSRLTGTIPLRILIGKRNRVEIKVHKKGPGASLLSKKSGQISEFITKRIEFEYIEAVRTAANAERAVTEMVSRELARLEANKEYSEAVQRITELQQPILDELAISIRDTLRKFLRDVKGVSISIPSEVRYQTMRHGCVVEIDDGSKTPLQYKGDGVQSLAALGILRHASEVSSSKKSILVAIEEPESHLHPNAIHELKAVLDSISEKHQLIITTHNPLFVQRRRIRENIVVTNKRAKCAKSIEEIRQTLGVRASDNLQHADLVLLVEGEDDRRAVRALLSHKSPYLSKAIQSGLLAVDSLGGGTNLAYKASLVRDALCLCHAFLDHDKAGIAGFDKAIAEGVLNDREVNFAKKIGLNESEMEDLYDKALYIDPVYNKFNVSLKKSAFRGKKKWADRVRACFDASGRRWDSRVEKELKDLVADLVHRSPGSALAAGQNSFNGLVEALEARLKSRESVSSNRNR